MSYLRGIRFNREKQPYGGSRSEKQISMGRTAERLAGLPPFALSVIRKPMATILLKGGAMTICDHLNIEGRSRRWTCDQIMTPGLFGDILLPVDRERPSRGMNYGNPHPFRMSQAHRDWTTYAGEWAPVIDVAADLGISKWRLYRAVASHRLPAFKVVRLGGRGHRLMVLIPTDRGWILEALNAAAVARRRFVARIGGERLKAG